MLSTIKKLLAANGTTFNYFLNINTLKTTIKCSDYIVSEGSTVSPLELLGFKSGFRIPAGLETESDGVIQISRVNVIRIECDLATGAYVDGKLSHTIYEFPSHKVGDGYKIIEQPQNLIYLPVVPRRISNIQISVVDQSGNLIDFRGETISCRIHIKGE